MKVTLATHGGQIAAMRLGRPARALDAETLPPSQKAELSRLIAVAQREASNQESKARRGADLESYEIRVEDDKGPVVLKSESPMSPAFAALLEWLQTHLPDD